MIAAIALRPMTQRPDPGSRLIVQMKTGEQISCSATKVYQGASVGIVLYAGKKALDERNATGWWPAPK